MPFPFINLGNIIYTSIYTYDSAQARPSASGGIVSVRHNARPAKGPCRRPEKILKYKCNLGLYPVNLRDKLYILTFIILLIWLNFLTPSLVWKTFWSPLRATQNFLPPSTLPSPPPMYQWRNSYGFRVQVQVQLYSTLSHRHPRRAPTGTLAQSYATAMYF